MIDERHFNNAHRIGTWLPVLLRDGRLVRIRIYSTDEELQSAGAYYHAGVATTQPLATPLEAAQIAFDVIYEWREANPYSNLGFFVGVLLLPDGTYVGGYQTRWSAS